MMKTTALLLLGCAMLAPLPAHADVFSSQNFSGGTTTLDALPGVNLDAVPGFSSGAGNCSEVDMRAFPGRAMPGETRGTNCRFGNFSITTTGGNQSRVRNDLTYGGNPPPWAQGWRP